MKISIKVMQINIYSLLVQINNINAFSLMNKKKC